MKKWMLISCLLLIMLPLLTSAPNVLAAQKFYDGTSSAEQQKALISVNKLRLKMGLSEVKLDPALVKAAVNHARYANAHYTLKSQGNLSAEEKGFEYYTQPTSEKRVSAAGYKGTNQEILETVYMKERAYEEFDMASEIHELSLVHNRREVFLNPEVSALGIARVGRSTVIVGVLKVENDKTTPSVASVYPYDGMNEVFAGYIEPEDIDKLIQGEGMTITVFCNKRDVSSIKASLSTQSGSRHISIPLSVKKLDSGNGYVLTAQRQLRSDRTYTADVSFETGGASLTKQWSFRTWRSINQLNIDDMPLNFAPPLNVVNGRSEVPMRYLFELFGAKVEWNNTDRTITAIKNGLTLKMKIDSHTAYINGKAVQLDSPPHIINVTYVPLRFISEAFGYEVEYDPNDRSVNIWTGLLDNSLTVFDNQEG
ncbi:stalk domain-containing protein [Paenibacillus luteus]|uniref:stalk domain-containing protein n=1 Tax=Paenibacillus luteus TaxID=2545753 RepID=UPI001F4F2EA1|nr:stalk domain-containing protein [Paenibacillus luteus]